MSRRDGEVRVKVFRGTLKTWDALFGEAASFASTIGRDRLITISHSEDRDDGVVAVWYWDKPASAAERIVSSMESNS